MLAKLKKSLAMVLTVCLVMGLIPVTSLGASYERTVTVEGTATAVYNFNKNSISTTSGDQWVLDAYEIKDIKNNDSSSKTTFDLSQKNAPVIPVPAGAKNVKITGFSGKVATTSGRTTKDQSATTLPANWEFDAAGFLIGYLNVGTLTLTVSYQYDKVTTYTPTAPTGGNISMSKTAAEQEGWMNSRLYDVALKASATDVNPPMPADIVLVIDNSGSMCEYSSGGTHDNDEHTANCRITPAYEAANEFLKKVMPAAGTENRISLVTFSGNYSKIDDTDNPKYVRTRVKLTDGTWENWANFDAEGNAVFTESQFCYADGGTPLKNGLDRANAILDAARTNGRKQFVIVMTDGAPSSNSNETNVLEAAKALHNDGVIVYSVGFMLNAGTGKEQQGGEAGRVVKGMASSTSNYKFASTAAELKDFFNIAAAATLAAGYDAKIVDVVPAGFRLTAESETAIKAAGGTVSFDDKTKETTITYPIGELNSTEKTLKYTLKAEDGYYGSMFTNDSANLVFKPSNPVVVTNNKGLASNDDGSCSATYQKPVVPVNVQAVNDNYTGGTKGQPYTVEASAGDFIGSNDNNTTPMNDDEGTAGPLVYALDTTGAVEGGTVVVDANGKFVFTPTDKSIENGSFYYTVTSQSVVNGKNVTLTARAMVTIKFTNAPTYTLTVNYVGPNGEIVYDRQTRGGYVFDQKYDIDELFANYKNEKIIGDVKYVYDTIATGGSNAPATGTFNPSDNRVVTVLYKKYFPVTTYHKILGTETEIAQAVTTYVPAGTPWNAEVSEGSIGYNGKNYIYKSTTGETSGNAIDSAKEVTHWYEEQEFTAIVNYVDIDTNAPIRDSNNDPIVAKDTGIADKDFSLAVPKNPIFNGKHYKFVKMEEGDPAPVNELISGIHTADVVYTAYYQLASFTATVDFVNESGEEIAPQGVDNQFSGDPFTSINVPYEITIDGGVKDGTVYRFVGFKSQNNGTIKEPTSTATEDSGSFIGTIDKNSSVIAEYKVVSFKVTTNWTTDDGAQALTEISVQNNVVQGSTYSFATPAAFVKADDGTWYKYSYTVLGTDITGKPVDYANRIMPYNDVEATHVYTEFTPGTDDHGTITVNHYAGLTTGSPLYYTTGAIDVPYVLDDSNPAVVKYVPDVYTVASLADYTYNNHNYTYNSVEGITTLGEVTVDGTIIVNIFYKQTSFDLYVVWKDTAGNEIKGNPLYVGTYASEQKYDISKYFYPNILADNGYYYVLNDGQEGKCKGEMPGKNHTIELIYKNMTFAVTTYYRAVGAPDGADLQAAATTSGLMNGATWNAKHDSSITTADAVWVYNEEATLVYNDITGTIDKADATVTLLYDKDNFNIDVNYITDDNTPVVIMDGKPSTRQSGTAYKIQEAPGLYTDINGVFWKYTGTYTTDPAGTELSGTLMNNITVNFIYTLVESREYTIEYYYDDVRDDNLTKTRGPLQIGKTFTLSDADKDLGNKADYAFDSFTLTNNGIIHETDANVIRVYFVSVYYPVTVEYRVGNDTGTEIHDAYVSGNTYKVGDSIDLSTTMMGEEPNQTPVNKPTIEFNGKVYERFNLDLGQPTGIQMISGGKTIYQLYKEKKYDYTVNFYYDNVMNDALTKTFAATEGTEINLDTVVIPGESEPKNTTLQGLITANENGYTHRRNETLPYTIAREDNVINVYYETVYTVTVEYYVDNATTPKSIATARTGLFGDASYDISDADPTFAPGTYTMNDIHYFINNDKSELSKLSGAMNNGNVVIKIYYDARATNQVTVVVNYLNIADDQPIRSSETTYYNSIPDSFVTYTLQYDESAKHYTPVRDEAKHTTYFFTQEKSQSLVGSKTWTGSVTEDNEIVINRYYTEAPDFAVTVRYWSGNSEIRTAQTRYYPITELGVGTFDYDVSDWAYNSIGAANGTYYLIAGDYALKADGAEANVTVDLYYDYSRDTTRTRPTTTTQPEEEITTTNPLTEMTTEPETTEPDYGGEEDIDQGDVLIDLPDTGIMALPVDPAWTLGTLAVLASLGVTLKMRKKEENND